MSDTAPITVGLLTDMWPSASEPHAGTFIRGSVARAAPGVRNVVLVPRLAFSAVHRRLWGAGVQGWQEGHEPPPQPHSLLRYRTLRVPKVGESVARAIGARTALARSHERPEVVHGHFLFGVAPAAVRLGRSLGVPSVVTAHGTDVRLMESVLPAARVAEILDACARATRVIAVSADLAVRLEQLGVARERIDVIPMGIDETVFGVTDKEAARAALGVARDARIILFVGRFTEEKGARILTQALEKIGESVTGYVAGPVDVNPAPLRALGILGPRLLARWLAAADVMCLPSFSEGMPVAIAEALATGTPVVATRVGGIPEQLTSSNGALVEPGDVAALVSALESALGAVWLPDSIRATSEAFWSSTVSAKLARIYREARR